MMINWNFSRFSMFLNSHQSIASFFLNFRICILFNLKLILKSFFFWADLSLSPKLLQWSKVCFRVDSRVPLLLNIILWVLYLASVEGVLHRYKSSVRYSNWRSGYCYLNKEECNLNLSKDDSFAERGAKNNKWNNGDRHKIHEIFLSNCFVFVIILDWKTVHSSAMTQIKAHLLEETLQLNCSQITVPVLAG